MTRTPEPLPSSLGPVFTAAEAFAAGVSARRLRAPDLGRVQRGLYRRGRRFTAEDVARALRWSDASVMLCGPTAAQVLGMPLPSALDIANTQQIHLTSVHARRSSRMLVWHRFTIDRDDVFDAQGCRLTGRVRTAMDLVEHLTPDDLVSVLDHLIRHPRPRFEGRSAPYATPEDLRLAIDSSRRTGRAPLRAALARARVGSDSPAETSLRLSLVRAGIPDPQLNVRVWESGVDLGEPNLSWPEWKVCVEHEGPSHLTPEQLAKDICRAKRRAAHGWLEIRTVAEHLRAGGRLAVHEVRGALRSRGWEG
ncbi:hypothetical protein Bra3105_08605 [Brachybacterium halotolerans subsp. kimchii]|uniref:hypothetical protein n=1 Tax=Brachybacterium halotolerans TaxID=2795215 RepID=UPI001E4F2F02|nr:hypothetical protein [Brachybacterium halotolerans]UEJ84350.1 hypothetical protein Bra3105_08605 [Brachybacterium halotolerans subsp. kimchii]